MAAQTIRKIYEIGWKPTHFLTSVATSVKAVMQPAGPEKAMGIISAGFVKDPTDPQWQDTPEYKEWLTWMKKYNTSVNVADVLSVWGYSSAQTMVAVLKASDDDLTRENAIRLSCHNRALLRRGRRLCDHSGDPYRRSRPAGAIGATGRSKAVRHLDEPGFGRLGRHFLALALHGRNNRRGLRRLVQAVQPVEGFGSTTCAIVGMAAMVGGGTGAAMTAVTMIFEMTRDYDLVMPSIVAVALAIGVRRCYRQKTSTPSSSWVAATSCRRLCTPICS